MRSLLLLALTFAALASTDKPSWGQVRFGNGWNNGFNQIDNSGRVAFWGLLAQNQGLTGGRWIPVGIFPDQWQAAGSIRALASRGIETRLVPGLATPNQLAQHALTADRGQAQLLQLLNQIAVTSLLQQASFPGSVGSSGFNPIEAAGFNAARRNAIESAGFNTARRNSINNAGFNASRRQQINRFGFPSAPANSGRIPSTGNFNSVAPNRGNFGTRPQ